MASLAGSDVRLAELIASISLATDLGLGQPMEHVLRSCILGLRIAEDLELEESERAVVYYVALLAWLGCHADAHEQSAWFGDDIALRADRHFADPVGMRFLISHVGRGEAPARRVRRLGSLLVSGREALTAMEATHCLVAGQFAMRLGLSAQVRDSLQHIFERWDGKGTPAGLRGAEIALPTRRRSSSDPIAHVGGLPVEETLGSFGPALLLGLGVAWANLRARLDWVRAHTSAHAFRARQRARSADGPV